MRKSGYREREGFSLVELIIAIAILALMVGIISLSIGLIRSADTKGLANGINSSLTDLKAETTAHHGTTYMYIYEDDGDYYAGYSTKNTFALDEIYQTKKLGDSGMTLLADSTSVDSTHPVMIRIQKKDGSYFAGAPSKFEVKKAPDKEVEYTVMLARDTGLHYLEQGEHVSATPAPEP